MRRSNYFEKAFTLVELIVVISIIAILATLVIANFNAARERARDAQRKVDLKNIQTALRMYYNDYGKYPQHSGNQIAGCDASGTSACGWGSPNDFIAGSQTYMSVMPQDPQSSDRTYEYTWVNNDEYTLVACLENSSDDKCDVNPGTGAIIGCTAPLSGCKYTVKP